MRGGKTSKLEPSLFCSIGSFETLFQREREIAAYNVGERRLKIVQLGDVLIHGRLKNFAAGWRVGMKNCIPAMPECQGVILDRPDNFGNVDDGSLVLIGRRYRRIIHGANKSPFDAKKPRKKFVLPMQY